MTSLLELLIYESMLACGMDAQQAAGAARKVAGDVRKAIPHVAESEDRAERDRRIYELRASGVSVKDLSDRFGLSRGHVHEIVHDDMIRRRSVA